MAIARDQSRRLRFGCLLGLILLGFCTPALALDKSRALTQYAQRIWQTQQGLPQATIYCVRQTKGGYLWLGTLTGLVRFDGARFTHIDKVGDITLGATPILDLAEDSAGTLWLATDGQGVIGVRDNAAVHLTFATGLPSDRALRLLVDSRNALWIATPAGLARWADAKLTVWTMKDGLATSDLRALCETKDGRIWAAGNSPSLSAWDGARFQTHALQTLPPGATIQALAAAPDGTLWAGTSTGLIALDPAYHERRFTPADGLADDYVWSLTMSADGILWAGTRDGFSRLHGNDIDSFHDKDGLSQSTVYGMCEDKEGSLWVATKHGLNQFLDGRTVPVTTREGLASNDTGPILQDAAGIIWVGTLDAGLSRFDGHAFTALTTSAGLPSNHIAALCAGESGDLWVGTDKGLARLHEGRVAGIYSTGQGLSAPRVTAILHDRRGDLWVGTNGGLAVRRGERFVSLAELGITVPDARGGIVALAQRSDDAIVFASETGAVYAVKDKAVETIAPAGGPVVDALFADADGALWMGTLGGGLRLVEGGRTFAFSLRDGLFDDDIFALVADTQGRLWMACSKGVFSVLQSNLRDFAAGKIGQLTSTPFSPTDALRTIECKTGVEPAGCAMADGRLWFATTRGVVILDPARLPRRLAPPPVVVEEVAVDGRAEAPEAIAALPAGRKNLMFRYTGLSFVAPGRITFRYQLEGFDKGWVDAGARREAFYTNLPPGRFHFRVQASNVDGVWTDPDVQSAAVDFALAPAWYQHAWFVPLCIAAAAAAGALAFHWRVRTLRHRMQLVVAERSRIARELHDTLLQGFAGVTMEMQALSVRLPTSSERRTLEEIIQDAARCLREARRSVAGLRDGAVVGGGLSAILEAAAREITAGADVQLSLDTRRAPAGAMALPANVEYNLMRIAREALANAVRHAGASAIDVTLAAHPDHLLLEIRDDGAGFLPQPEAAGHFGLIGMRERAGEIGADFDLLTAPGEGTLVRVRLALHRKAEPAAPAARGVPA